LVDFLESGIEILSEADKTLLFSSFQRKKSKQQQPQQSVQSIRQK
jgi:hypothetical protein